MSDEPRGGGERLVIEIDGVDKRHLAMVWDKMKAGHELVGAERYIGQSMADHPEWFPFYETIGVLEGDDTLPDGQNPFAHTSFHILIGSQIFNRSPKEAEVFYRMRLRKGDEPHDIIHMLINVFQRHLMWTAQATRQGQSDGQFDLNSYAKTLKSLWKLKTDRIWERLGHPEAPPRHGA